MRLSGSTYRVCAPPDGNPHKLIDTYGPRMGECVESLTDEQVWWRPNEASNSVGNLLLYPNGDVRQRLVAPFRGVKDERDRLA